MTSPVGRRPYRQDDAATVPVEEVSTPASAIRWEDVPAKSWAPEVEPTAEQLARWLRSLTLAHLVWVLDRQRATWSQESRCFTENHPGYIQHLEGRVRELQERLSAAGEQRG